jgi:hypothetical protein
VSSFESMVARAAFGVSGSTRPAPRDGREIILELQTIYSIISFMSPNSMTVSSSIMTMRP